MKKRIITIERQYGSGGSVIGRLVAEKLGVNYYNRSILEMASKKCGLAPETLESAEENVPTSFLYSLMISANPMRSIEDNLPLSDKVFLMESGIIKDIAASEHNFVLVGRCGNYILEDEGCFSVYIYSSMESRIKRSIEEYGIEPKRAESVIKKADKRRETFYNVNTGNLWHDKEQYGICLNSGELGDELCAELIVAAFKQYNS